MRMTRRRCRAAISTISSIQSLVELAVLAEREDHPVAGIGQRRVVQPDRERADHLRPAAPDLVIQRLLLGRELFRLQRFETGHSVLLYFSGVLPSGGRTSKLFRKIPTMA